MNDLLAGEVSVLRRDGIWRPGDWAWSWEYREPVKVIEALDLWGKNVCRVWVPGRDAVIRVQESELSSITEAGIPSRERLIYTAAAARIAESLARPDILLAPLEGSVTPLPHQLYALSRAVSGNRVRYLLADEVGLGKTIEAGLITGGGAEGPGDAVGAGNGKPLSGTLSPADARRDHSSVVL